MADADTPKAETDLDVMDAVLASEPDVTDDARSAVPAEPQASKATPQRSGVFIPALLGGAIALAAGFGLSHYNLLGTAPVFDTIELDRKLAVMAEQTDAMKADLARLAAQPAPNGTLPDRMAAIESAIAALPPADTTALDQRMTAIEAQMTAIVAMPTGGGGASPAALAALQAQVDGLKGAGANLSADIEAAAAAAEVRLAAAEEQANALRAEAEGIAAAAKATAAISRIQAALESGAPFASALADLPQADIPAVLAEGAATGLPTLQSLQDGFPDAARLALEAALRANMGESWAERVGSFLRSQTGARSLTPREGTDPDAVLSRAEAALTAGDVAAAVAEIAGLPGEGKAAMAEWVDLAQRRIAASDAVAALSIVTDE